MGFRGTGLGIGTVPIRHAIWIEGKCPLRRWRDGIRSARRWLAVRVDCGHFTVRVWTAFDLVFPDQFTRWSDNQRGVLIRFDQCQRDIRLCLGERTCLISLSACHWRRRGTGNIIEQNRHLGNEIDSRSTDTSQETRRHGLWESREQVGKGQLDSKKLKRSSFDRKARHSWVILNHMHLFSSRKSHQRRRECEGRTYCEWRGC